MRTKYAYLNDTPFLFELAKAKNLELFIKIIILSMDERPIKEIQGKVLNGNINVDGSSSVRRTGNLSVYIEDSVATYMEIGGLFSLNKKIKIEVGLSNPTKQYLNYPILWFPQGVYAIVNLSSSHGTSGTNISLQIKDKMVYLNGECGGKITASTTLDEYDVIDPETGEYAIEKPTIVQIIRELVNHYGGEQLGKIIISNLDSEVKKVMKWTQDNYLYYYQGDEPNESGFSHFFTLTPLTEGDSEAIPKINQKIQEEKDRYNALNSTDYTQTDWTKLTQEHNDKIAKLQEELQQERDRIIAENPENITGYEKIKAFSAGEDIGYIYSSFYFPKELVANAGDSVCTVLDTIKNTLGNFEYFYDLDGNFVFQEIKNYLNTSQSTHILNSVDASDYLVDRTKGKAVYSFDNSEIITSFSNSPQYANVKNDFVVWGLRETVEGDTLPIRYHLAIDSKPQVGNTYNYYLFDDPEAINPETLNPIRKARVGTNYDKINELFPTIGEIGRLYVDITPGKPNKGFYWNKKKFLVRKVKYPSQADFPEDPTKEEELQIVFYVDANGNEHYYKWDAKSKKYISTVYSEDRRPVIEHVINPLVIVKVEEDLIDGEHIYNGEELKTTRTEDYEKSKIEYRTYYHPADLKTRTTTDWREELYFSGVNTTRFGTDANYYYTELENEWTKLYDYDISNPNWKDEVFNNPTELDYFLDFIDSSARVSEFSISNIGRRTHVVNDDSINCIFEPDIPNYILIESDGDITNEIKKCDERNQPWIGVDSTIWAGITQGGSYNSAFNMIQDLLYQYTGYNESISLQTLPMYFLEPNIRIAVKNEETGIYGEYMLNNFSIPLDINGTMSLSCTKALERI